jgi:hypothetical protein
MAEEKDQSKRSRIAEAEMRIEESTASGSATVILEGISLATAPPRVDEKIEVQGDKFKVIEVSHMFSGSPLKYLIVVTVERPQATVAQSWDASPAEFGSIPCGAHAAQNGSI